MSTIENWTIVCFTEEESVEIVPTKWLINKENCFWPNSFSVAKLTSAIKYQFNPEKNWKKCSIKCLSKTPIDDFKVASKIANQATITSDIESIMNKEIAKDLPKKRSKPSKKNYDDLSSDDELVQSKLKYPKPNKVNANDGASSSKIDFDSLEYHLDLIDESTLLVADKNISVDNLLQYGNEEYKSFTKPKEKCSSNAYGASDTVDDSNQLLSNNEGSVSNITNEAQATFQRHVSRLLVSIELRLDEQSKMMSNIMLAISEMKNSKSTMYLTESSNAHNNLTSEIYSILPVKSNDELADITSKLMSNDEEILKLAKMLTLIGGSDEKQLIRRILKKLMADSLAIFYNYTGHKNAKNAFNKTILSTLLTKAVQMVYCNITIKDIETTASIWLTKSSERMKNLKK